MNNYLLPGFHLIAVTGPYLLKSTIPAIPLEGNKAPEI